MVDTISFKGYVSNYILPVDIKQFRYTEFADTGRRVTETLVTKGKNFRAFYDMNFEMMRVELSLPKAISGQDSQKNMKGQNCFNYCQPEDANWLDKCINDLVLQFFEYTHEVAIDRIDIGHVQRFADRRDMLLQLELYKNNKPHGQAMKKLAHQKYKNTAMYVSKNYSIKAYDKGEETKFWHDGDYKTEDMLRFEISYRAQHLKQLGYDYVPWKGAMMPFYTKDVIEDYLKRMSSWEMGTKVVPDISAKGVMGILGTIKILDPEIFKQIQLNDYVSRSTMHRFNKLNLKTVERKEVDIKMNIPESLKNKVLMYYNTRIIPGFNGISY